MARRDAFVQQAPAELRAQLAAIEDLEARLNDLARAAHEAWPTLAIEGDVFLSYAAERLPPDRDAAATLSSLRARELMLCCAAAAGSDEAVRLFREQYVAKIRAALGRSGPSEWVDDMAQQVMSKLFVGPTPAIAKYAGRGDLGAWLQVVAVRLLRSRQRKKREVVRGDSDEMVAEALATDDPELRMLKRTYRAQFKQAFEVAMGKLSTRERNLLRQEYLDGLSIDQIAALYGVHRATAARWRQNAREQLFKGVTAAFETQFELPRRELDSVMRLIRSQLEVSFNRLLAKPEPKEEAIDTD